MKLTLNLLLAVVFILGLQPGYAQSNATSDSTGLPGDQFSLEGAIELFKKSSSPEEFEKLLNTENNHVNNLDLNGDGDIDYIKVIDHMDQDVHALVLQIAVSENENQDIAVLEIEKDGKESAVLQIIGDEEIFGEAIVIEPSDDQDINSTKKGPSISTDDALIVNVWMWPSVRYIYAPVYRPWVSPWRWRVYPAWWRPWRPLGWHVYRPFRANYRVGYIHAPVHRVVRAHKVYTPIRVSSVTVRTRNHTAVNNYKVNRTKTTVTSGRGNRQVKATKTKTTVTGKKGNNKVKASRTKTSVSRKKH